MASYDYYESLAIQRQVSRGKSGVYYIITQRPSSLITCVDVVLLSVLKGTVSVLQTGTVGQATACATPLVNPTIMPCTHTHWLDLAQQHWACGMMDPACGFHLVPGTPSSKMSISAWL